MAERHDAQLAYGALAMAAAVRGGNVAGVIFHTDQGSEGLVRAACTRLGISQSIGRPGSALDNAAIEAWHSTLEFELRSREEDFPTRAAARARVAAWIDQYNTTRRSPGAPSLSHDVAPGAWRRCFATRPSRCGARCRRCSEARSVFDPSG